ncbi:MAG: hypothetical protein IJ661_12160 [Lachnospiraceae bacterium]|nr:hypothetical protein [Lachnospiraceae bacterium]
MNKPTVNMTNWSLYVYDERYNLSGTADYHPKLGKNTYIGHTSHVENYSLENDILTYETRNTIYVCPLKYMEKQPYSYVIPEYKEELTHRADASDSCLDKIISTAAKMAVGGFEADEYVKHVSELIEKGHMELRELEDRDNARMIDIVKNYEDAVYIEVSNINSGDKLAYHLGDYAGVVIPEFHSGMFQDSVLYMKYGIEEDNDCRLDFRYFPKAIRSMETYSWSDNIKYAIIKNEEELPIWFNGNNISAGETKVFTTKGHHQGLVSPDCYNGKSVYLDAFMKLSEQTDDGAEDNNDDNGD